MSTSERSEGALQEELSSPRDRLDAVNLQQRIRCALREAEVVASKLHEAFSVSKEHMHRVQDELPIRLEEIQQLRSALAEARNELERHRKTLDGPEQAAHTRATILERELDVT